MNEELDYKYLGNQQPLKEEKDTVSGRKYHPYIANPDLIEAVNLAIDLKRPLLLEGQPGCGKTRLAHALVYEYTKRHLDSQKDERGRLRWWPFYIWNVKSSSRAKDGLYVFDAIARLRDAQLVGNTSQLDAEKRQEIINRLNNPQKYRQFGPLGSVLRPKYDLEEAQKWQQILRPVLLIDEIDKADSDFANDLLFEIDEKRFDIPETEEWDLSPTMSPDSENEVIEPIIIITSNQEKPLPEAFLRRCLYYYVPFPEKDILQEIAKRRFGESTTKKEDVITKAIARFYEIHGLLEEQPGSRPPGTSEFLEFLGVLLDKKEEADAIADLENLAKRLPLLGILLKTQADQQLFLDAPGERVE